MYNNGGDSMKCMSCEGHAHECLQRVPIFKHLSLAEQQSISEITFEKTYKKGEMIYQAGDEFHHLMVLSQGKIKLSRISFNGKEQIMRVVEAGDFIGELSLFSHGAVKDYATVLEDVVMCVVDATRLKTLMASQPQIAFKIMETLTTRLDDAETIIQTHNLVSVDSRIAQKLLEMADDEGVVALDINRKDLANLLGITQETFSRKLKLFEDQKWISATSPRVIKILNQQALLGIEE